MFIYTNALMKTKKVSLFTKIRFLEIGYASITKILNNIKYDFIGEEWIKTYVGHTIKLSKLEGFFIEAL